MKTSQKAGAGSLAVISAAASILVVWEGMDPVAKKDMIGTGHPVTFCYGSTTHDDPNVKEGTRFTKKECDERLKQSLPKYLAAIDKCIKVDLPVKTKAALLDAAYNAGPAAVCRSPMLKKMHAGDLEGGCNAFEGWYTRSDGKERRGLIARRSGLPGDKRKNEKQLCLEGVKEGLPKPLTLWDKIKLFFKAIWKGN
jgi:lysozyme